MIVQISAGENVPLASRGRGRGGRGSGTGTSSQAGSAGLFQGEVKIYDITR